MSHHAIYDVGIGALVLAGVVLGFLELLGFFMATLLLLDWRDSRRLSKEKALSPPADTQQEQPHDN